MLCTLMEVTNVLARSRSAPASDTCSLGLLTTREEKVLENSYMSYMIAWYSV